MPKRTAKTQPLPAGWRVSTRMQSSTGRWIESGTELTVAGIRGRVKFLKRIDTPSTSWIDVLDRECHFRSVRPEAVKTVHWKNKLRASR